MSEFTLLKDLVSIHAPTGEEYRMKEFILEFVASHEHSWKVRPQIIEDDIQDSIILVFGKPKVAVFAHMDTVGFSCRYENQLLPIGSPAVSGGETLSGKDALGEIACNLELSESGHMHHDFPRAIDRGTSLVYRSNFKENKNEIKSPYLDNRLGVYVALRLARTIDNAALVFGCGEEHGGGSAGMLSARLFKEFNISKNLICDVTWVTDGVLASQGVAVSMRDAFIPRRSYVDQILNLAEKSGIPYQIEVEGSGGSDGSEIHLLPYPIDWCFIGAPILKPHAAVETVNKSDVLSMTSLYQYLVENL